MYLKSSELIQATCITPPFPSFLPNETSLHLKNKSLLISHSTFIRIMLPSALRLTFHPGPSRMFDFCLFCALFSAPLSVCFSPHCC